MWPRCDYAPAIADLQTPHDCRHGTLAFGDSITNGGGELQWGVALQSWALWLSRSLGLSYAGYAVDGARVEDVLRGQIPLFRATSAHPDGRYDLGCLYIGVNDVRALDWDAREFERSYREALQFLRERCDRVLTMAAPLDLGRPRAGSKVRELNGVIERVASELGVLVADLSDFGARNLVMADHVHPTAFGQIAIAERALAVLERAGMTRRLEPRSLIVFETTRLGRLRGDARYAYRHARVMVKGVVFGLTAAAHWLRSRLGGGRRTTG